MTGDDNEEVSYFDYKGRNIPVDANGHLVNTDDWSEDLALAIADAEGITMTDAHWEIVDFVRDYYRQFRITLALKPLLSEVGKKFGPAKGSTKYLYGLFDDRPTRLANKIGGLPRPIG